MPIVALRLGYLNVTVMAKTQVAKDTVIKTLKVEADGIPQYTHTSVVLDLSKGRISSNISKPMLQRVR